MADFSAAANAGDIGLMAVPANGTLLIAGAIDLVYSADRSQLYVARAGGLVSILNAATGTEIRTIQVGTDLGGIDVSPDGSYLLVAEKAGTPAAGGTSFALHRVDLATGTVSDYSRVFTSIDGPFNDVAFLADGTALALATWRGTGPGSAYQLDPQTGQFTKVSTGTSYTDSPPQGGTLTVSADGLHAFAGGGTNASGAGIVFELAPDGSVRQSAVRPMPTGSLIGYAHDGSLIVYRDYSGVTVFDGALQPVTTLSALNGASALTFDATRSFLYAFVPTSFGSGTDSQLLKISTSSWTVVDQIAVPSGSAVPITGGTLTIGLDNGYFTLISDGQLIRIENPDAPQPVSGSDGNSVMSGGSGDDLFYGQGGDDDLQGNAGNDILHGGTGADRLDGGTGRDVMLGGDGDDIYIVDDSADRAIEASASGGSDEVRASASFVLEDHIERLVLTGSAAINGTGNNAANLIIGNAAANVLNGMGGNDTLQGNDGDDVLNGGAGDDILEGGLGNDTLNGGPGTDLLIGGDGDDSYYYDPEDTIVETANGGSDTLIASGTFTLAMANIENLRATPGTAIATLTGDAGNNRITGNDGVNTLDGAGGDDALFGMGGNDILVVSAGHDTADGGAGSDTLRVYTAGLALSPGPRSFTLTANRITDASGTIDTSFTTIERVDFWDASGAGVTFDASGYSGGTLRIEVDGGQNSIIGGASADLIVVVGGSGTIDAGASTDTVSLSFDTSSVTGVLTQVDGAVVFSQGGNAVYTIRNAESFGMYNTLGGAMNVDISATNLNVSFTGTASADRIIGGSGANLFTSQLGGAGDVLTGGGGADLYRFTSVAGLNGVTITDFDGDDRIDLSLISPQARYIGTSEFSGTAGEYRYVAGNGVTLLLGDSDGDGEADHGLLIGGGAYVLGETGFNTRLLQIVGQMPPNDEGPNSVTGTEGVDYIDTGAGDDHVQALGGDDVVNGGDGNDVIDGGAGNDTLHGDNGDDILNGGAGEDYVSGDAGNDTIYATGGDDWLMGGAGDDTIIAAGGKYNIFGDDVDNVGNDRITLTGGTDGSWIDAGGGDDVVSASGSGAIILTAGAGDDDITIDGFVGGNVSLDAGNDTLRIRNGGGYVLNLTETFGTGRDRVVIESLQSGMTVIGMDAGEQGDVLDLSAFGADPFGTGVLTIVQRGPDTDIIVAATGARILLQFTIAANLSAYNLGGVQNPLFAPQGATLHDAFASDPTIDWASNLVGADGDDEIYGHGGNDWLFGGGGNDYLVGGLGADHMDGGSGSDTVGYQDETAPVIVNLATGQGSGNAAEGDTYANIESAIGGSGNDQLIGSDGANTLLGGAGHDWLMAGGGDDVLLGGDGHDSVWGGDGDDLLYGGEGDDTIDGGAGIDTADYNGASGGVTVDLGWMEEQNTYGAGVDTLIGIENLRGSSFDDVFTGNQFANSFLGGAGNDRFVFNDSALLARDSILDFAAGDLIDLRPIDANGAAPGDAAFEWVGGAAFSGVAGELRVSGSGYSWRVEGDLNGDGVADFSIDVATSASGYAFSSGDFLL